jgi:hypothetical protein
VAVKSASHFQFIVHSCPFRFLWSNPEADMAGSAELTHYLDLNAFIGAISEVFHE